MNMNYSFNEEPVDHLGKIGRDEQGFRFAVALDDNCDVLLLVLRGGPTKLLFEDGKSWSIHPGNLLHYSWAKGHITWEK